jgi:hypothetical protein
MRGQQQRAFSLLGAFPLLAIYQMTTAAKYSSQLQFWLPLSSCKSELVFLSKLDVGEAVEAAFEASNI